MAGNIVEILVGARDTDAIRSLDDVKLKLDELARKVAEAKVKLAGDKEAELQLDRMTVSLLRLDRKTANPKITLEGALRAEAQVVALDLAMDRLNRKSSESGGFLSKLSGGFSGLGNAMAGALGNLPLIGGMFSAFDSAGVVAIPVVVGITTALAGLVLALGPVVAGLGAAAVGFAAFAAGAVGEISKVIKAHQALATAQKAYENAKTPTARLAALQAEKQAVDGLTGSEKGLMGMLSQLGGDFSKLQAAVRPQVVTAFGTALQIIHRLMPTITTLATAAGIAFDGLLKNIENWLNSGSGKKFLAWLQTEGPAAIQTFTTALWDIIKVVGNVLYWWDRLGNDVIKAAMGMVAGWAGAAKMIIGGFKSMTDAFMTMIGAMLTGSAKVASALHLPIAGALKQAAADFGNFRTSVDQAFQGAMDTVSQWQTDIKNMPKIVKLQGDIADLQAKIATAKAEIKSVPPSKQSVLRADIRQYEAAIARARIDLAMLHDKTITIYSRLVGPGFVAGLGGHTSPGKASGGIVGAAGGGPRGGLTWVGEQGPELVRLPYGSTVYPAGQSAAMAAQAAHGGGDTYNVNVQVAPGTSPAETGRQIAYYLGEFKKRGGKIYSPAGF